MVNKKDDKLLAFGTKRASHRIILLEISMPNTKDPVGLKELVQLSGLSDYDEFTVRLVDVEANRHILVAALVEGNRYAIHKIILSGLQPSSTFRSS